MANAYTTKQFDHNHLTKSFSAEASDLPGFSPTEWIALTSHKTGEVIVFEHANTEKDAEGDVQVWTFRIRRVHAEANRALRGYTITVFND